MIKQSTLTSFNEELSNKSLSDKFLFVFECIEGKKVFSTSMGIEDQMIIHILSKLNLEVSCFTLDTGRLFNETYETYQKTQNRYTNISITSYFPSQIDLQEYVKEYGINGFYNSVEARKKCCNIRKIRPLQQALKDAKLWITGLRAEQSEYRKDLNYLHWDEHQKVMKFNPLLKHTLEEIEEFVKENKIPISPLYYKGYLSIGCAPCTRALQKGEDFRSGRWWWEQSHKECGLHE